MDIDENVRIVLNVLIMPLSLFCLPNASFPLAKGVIP